MQSGRSLWAELVGRYDRGLKSVGEARRMWRGLQGRVDPERHAEVSAFLIIQEHEARWWRNASIAYWQSVTGRPLPPGVAPPPHSLKYYKSLSFPHAPGHWP